MGLYSYVKAKNKHKKPQKKLRLFSFLLIISGVIILLFTISPIIFFDTYYGDKFSNLKSPIPNETINQVFGNEIAGLFNLNTDYTKASSWFPKATNVQRIANDTQYTLSIPKLNIDNATVLVGTEDLSKSLIHFTGSMPGKLGNPVIFGHSTLTWLYNPKDYKTIFTKLPQLTYGDDIYVNFESLIYHFQVTDMKITTPDNLQVLAQTYDDSYITLVTCVPPGTSIKRLVVRGKLAIL